MENIYAELQPYIDPTLIINIQMIEYDRNISIGQGQIQIPPAFPQMEDPGIVNPGPLFNFQSKYWWKNCSRPLI